MISAGGNTISALNYFSQVRPRELTCLQIWFTQNSCCGIAMVQVWPQDSAKKTCGRLFRESKVLFLVRKPV
jgi:hypothetical protein